MKGTDLTSSIIAVQIIRIIGNVDVLPKASITPNGNDIAIPKKGYLSPLEYKRVHSYIYMASPMSSNKYPIITHIARMFFGYILNK